jgi:hypothetical protein
VPATREDVWSPGPLLLAATVAVALVIGAFAGTEFHPNETRVANPSPSRSGEHRQVQFETPGGTRVIWVLNSDLDF